MARVRQPLARSLADFPALQQRWLALALSCGLHALALLWPLGSVTLSGRPSPVARLDIRLLSATALDLAAPPAMVIDPVPEPLHHPDARPVQDTLIPSTTLPRSASSESPTAISSALASPVRQGTVPPSSARDGQVRKADKSARQRPRAAPPRQAETPTTAGQKAPVARDAAARSAATASAAPAPAEPTVDARFDAAYLANPPPQYPFSARRLGLEGTVTLRVLVNPEGLPDEIELRRSSGSSILDQSALKAVQAWRFVPARRSTTAVASWVEVPVHFRLD